MHRMTKSCNVWPALWTRDLISNTMTQDDGPFWHKISEKKKNLPIDFN